MIIGTDIGYSYTKDNSERIFKSAITTDEYGVTGGTKVEINGKVYYAGVGTGTVDVNKANAELTKVLFLTDLWLNNSADGYHVITGLPIGQYKSHKHELKQSIMSWNGSFVNGKKIIIFDCTIFPQAAGALYSAAINDDCIIADVGGRTTDIGKFEFAGGKPNLIEPTTIYKGMEGLFSEVVKAVNNKFELSLEPRNGERILRSGLTVDGQKMDLSFLDEVIMAYIKPIKDILERDYHSRSTMVYFCGGGGSTFAKQLKIKNSMTLENSQFSNAKGFYRVGTKIYGGGKPA
jgi:plasmid segregation protein ParM